MQIPDYQINCSSNKGSDMRGKDEQISTLRCEALNTEAKAKPTANTILMINPNAITILITKMIANQYIKIL